ncbi:hypothetical protein [Methylocapsa palsarum]|uniref:Uncharacterized protein n=1 Tax=Methylocapsa palsarum TaxID=1612308 RepID=A0A1I4D057_9HYPH|nr:hypothetical protein [Methylocapsa palsarum]SFK85481.1 hypothetical protein SAMN05444581_13024 [Methylocapsa palsarum]
MATSKKSLAEERPTAQPRKKRSKNARSSVPELSDYSTIRRVCDDAELESIAKLITSEPPAWLIQWLYVCFQCVQRDLQLDDETPTRAHLAQMLAEIRDAIEVLSRFLTRGDLVIYLGSADQPLSLPRIMFLQRWLHDIYVRASNASESELLVGQDGKIKSGRGRIEKRGLPARTICALLISETWESFQGRYPPVGSRGAAEAAESLWQVSVGRASGQQGADNLKAWSHHFREAMSQPAETHRVEYRKIMDSERSFWEQTTIGEKFVKGNKSS